MKVYWNFRLIIKELMIKEEKNELSFKNMHFNEAADMYSIWPKMNMKFWKLYISDIFIADFLHELLINISLYLTIRCLSKIIFSQFMIKYLFFLSI